MVASYRMVKRIAGFSLAVLFSKAITLVTLYVIAFFATDEQFGYFSLVQSGFVFSLVFFGFSLNSVYLRNFYESGLGEISQALRPIYCCLAVAACLAFAALLWFFDGHSYYMWLAVMPFCGLLAGISVTQSTIFRCSNKAHLFFASEAARPLAVLVAVGFFFTVFDQGNVVAVYSLSLLGSYLVAILVLAPAARRSEGAASGRPLDTRVLLLYVAPLVAVQLMSALNNIGDRYLLAAFVPIEAVGQYGKAYLVGSTVGVLADSLSLLWGPYVVRHKALRAAELARKAKMVFAASFCVSLACLLGALLWRPVDVVGVSGEVISVAMVVFAAFLVRVGYQVYVPLLTAFDLTGLVARISLCGSLAGLLVNVMLIPVYGLIGAALATWVSFFIFSTFSFLAFIRRFADPAGAGVDAR